MMYETSRFIMRTFGLTTTAAVAVSLTLGGSVNVCRADDWQSYHDTRLGFQIAHPAGWEVQATGRRILVRSQDHAAFVVIENFKREGDETAEDHVDALPRSDGDVLPRAVVQTAGTLDGGSDKSEQAVGRLSYWGERGQGRALVLCQVFPRGGLWFGLGAAENSFDQERPELMKILQSLRFDAARTGGGGSNETAASSGPRYQDALSKLSYKHWSDSKENGFSAEVPVGWTVAGGTFRAGPLDVRQSLQVRSPHGEMAVMIGDAGLTNGFVIPDFFTQSQGLREGSIRQAGAVQQTVMHFMPAAEFNRWYLTNYLGKVGGELEITDEKDLPELVQKLNALTPPVAPPAHVEITAAVTHFTCRDPKSGVRLSGMIQTLSQAFIGNAQGQGNWTAQPRICVWADGDARAEQRQQEALAVFRHLNQTFQLNPSFVASEKRRTDAFIAATRQATQAAIATMRQNQQRTVAMSRANAASSDARRRDLMSSFRAQQAAKDENRRQQVNYALDQTDVTDGSGSSWKVGSGYSNYYRNSQTGAVLGTNSASHPGVNWSPLSQY